MTLRVVLHQVKTLSIVWTTLFQKVIHILTALKGARVRLSELPLLLDLAGPGRLGRYTPVSISIGLETRS